MALPPIDMDDELEADDESAPEDELEPAEGEAPADVDPLFAADVVEAFPDLEDTQIAALQRAVLGLIAAGQMPPPNTGMGM